MRRSLAILLVPLALTLAGCPREEPFCTPASQKASVRELMSSWYLYPDLLPIVDPSDPAYPGVQEYLDALTSNARALDLDRGWTYATTAEQQQAYYAEGTSVGFGIGLLDRDPRLFISQVFPGSAAAGASFARGDELLAIGDTPESLVAVSTLRAGAGIGSALGPSSPGVTRTFQVMPVGGSEPVLRTVVKATYSLDPVPEGAVLIPQGDGVPPIGYVALRTFITPADAALQSAVVQFQEAGVRDVVVDLRYNGGGLVSTADLLANLLAGGRSTADVMFSVENNVFHASQNQSVSFDPPAEAITPLRIAFITTGASASASELVPNVLEAYVSQGGSSVALVGAKTYGKPVGQRGFLLEECGTVVYLVSLRLVNADGDGGYFDGLPDAEGNFEGPLCEAEDDLAHPQSDRTEASTAAAIQWLTTSTCPAPPAAAAKPSGPSAALKPARAADAYPEAPAPDLAQRHVRGLF